MFIFSTANISILRNIY